MGRSIATLTIGDDCYKLESFESMVKSKTSGLKYRFMIMPKGNCAAVKSIESEFIGKTLFTYESMDTILRVDTIFDNRDTTVNGLTAKIVSVNYVRGGLRDGYPTTRFFPLDTVKMVHYITDKITEYTPFSFVSAALKGLIIKSYMIHRKQIVGRINTSYSLVNVAPSFYEIPKSCIIYSTVKEYDNEFN